MIERWALSNNCNCPSMSACEDGEFVLYEDHAKVVNHLLDVLHGINTQIELWFDYASRSIEQEIAKVKKQPPDLTAGEFNRRE